MKIIIEVFGWMSVFLSIISYIPQSYKVIKIKNADGLSKNSFFIIMFGAVMFIWFSVASDLWQSLASNIVVLILILPIFYFLFNKNLKIFLLIVFFVISIISSSIALVILKQGQNEVVSIIFSMIGGLTIGIRFIPQIIKIIKTKNISSISITMVFLIIFSNNCWILYYVFIVFSETKLDIGVLLTLIFLIIGTLFSSTTVFVYFKYKKIFLYNK